MARKPRKAARGRHNRARLRRMNEILFSDGIAAQLSLTRAIPLYKRLLAKRREEEKLKATVKSLKEAK